MMGYGAEGDEELLNSLSAQPESMRYITPDKTDKKPLDYAHLFGKPTIEWKDIAKTKSGVFITEFGHGQHEDVRKIVCSVGLRFHAFGTDLGGITRCLSAFY